MSLVGQWCAEASSKLRGSTLRMHQYHGQGRCKDPFKLAKFDLVRGAWAGMVGWRGGGCWGATELVETQRLAATVHPSHQSSLGGGQG